VHGYGRSVRLSLLFHEFPDGRVGLGLLLLRAAVGAVIVFQGAMELTGNPDPGIGNWITGLCEVVIGGSVLAGFLTQVAAALLGLTAAGWWTAVIPVPHPNLFPSRLFVCLLIVMAMVIVLLGPGAFSIDARLFGLREIIIPRSRSHGQIRS